MRRIVLLVVLTAALALMAVSPALAQGEIRQVPLEACGMPQLRELALAGGANAPVIFGDRENPDSPRIPHPCGLAAPPGNIGETPQ
jgi:hypothetical protein